jgi:serine/threonine protein kinase
MRPQIVFFNKYKPIKKIGEGSFGKIYLSNNINTNDKYAIKLENRNSPKLLLEQEAYMLYYLKGKGIPYIKSYGYSGEYNILIMELLGKSLDKLFEENHYKFSIKTVCMLGEQMITRLQYIHNKHILHRDIKPDNFIMGIDNNKDIVYLIDFGLSKKYRSSRTLQHIKYSENKKLIGTARYASIHALEELEQSRRDDLESVGYVLIYFLKGSLPWQGLKAKGKEERYRKILEKKKEISSEELCKGFPIIFQNFVYYVKNLDYLEEPDYENLKNMFIGFINNELNENFDFIYDWTTIFDIKKRKDFNNDLYSYYQFSEKSVNRRQTESLIYKKKINKEVTTTNGNNLTLYRTSPTEGNNILNNSKYNNSNINVIFEKKKLDDNASSRCCIM